MLASKFLTSASNRMMLMFICKSRRPWFTIVVVIFPSSLFQTSFCVKEEKMWMRRRRENNSPDPFVCKTVQQQQLLLHGIEGDHESVCVNWNSTSSFPCCWCFHFVSCSNSSFIHVYFLSTSLSQHTHQHLVQCMSCALVFVWGIFVTVASEKLIEEERRKETSNMEASLSCSLAWEMRGKRWNEWKGKTERFIIERLFRNEHHNS